MPFDYKDSCGKGIEEEILSEDGHLAVDSRWQSHWFMGRNVWVNLEGFMTFLTVALGNWSKINLFIVQNLERPTKIKDPKKHGGFVKYEREALPLRSINDRLNDWEEVVEHGQNDALLKTQSARCMDCGTPFCQQVSCYPIFLLPMPSK